MLLPSGCTEFAKRVTAPMFPFQIRLSAPPTALSVCAPARDATAKHAFQPFDEIV
jgi:hypothetical protein